MAETKIQWTETIAPDGRIVPGFTMNPWVGCTHRHTGCINCYAESYAKRYGKAVWGAKGTRVKTSDSYWRQPIRWNNQAKKDGIPRKVFCASLADIFEDWSGPVHDHHGSRISHIEGACEIVATLADLRKDLFRLIDKTPMLTWLLLTKRPENVSMMWVPWCGAPDFCGDADGQTMSMYRPNAWIGTSVSNQQTADEYAPELLKLAGLAPVLFLSCEPLLGPVDLTQWLGKGIKWVITGGESGPGARECHQEWELSIIDQCRAAKVPVFRKQAGENSWFKGQRVRYADRKGGDMSQWPKDLRVREFPPVSSLAG